jgi:hypothetical protein
MLDPNTLSAAGIGHVHSDSLGGEWERQYWAGGGVQSTGHLLLLICPLSPGLRLGSLLTRVLLRKGQEACFPSYYGTKHRCLTLSWRHKDAEESF